MLARRERGDRDLVVGVARGADVDDVDGRILDHVLPAGGVRGEAEALGGGLDRAGGAPGQSVQMRGQRQLDEAVRVAPGMEWAAPMTPYPIMPTFNLPAGV